VSTNNGKMDGQIEKIPVSTDNGEVKRNFLFKYFCLGIYLFCSVGFFRIEKPYMETLFKTL